MRKQLTLVLAGASMAFSAKSPPRCLRQVSQRDNSARLIKIWIDRTRFPRRTGRIVRVRINQVYHLGASLSEHALLIQCFVMAHKSSPTGKKRKIRLARETNTNPFCLSRKLFRYTHAWTKLHNKV